MGRGRRRRDNTILPERDPLFRALNDSLLPDLTPFADRPFDGLPGPMVELEDRRTFHPDGEFRNLISDQGRQVEAPLVVPRSRTRALSPRLAFPEEHGKALVCVRRKTRKEVMIAKRQKRRRGAGGGRRWFSDIKC